MQGKRNEWAKQSKEEVFSTSLDNHISAKKTQHKARNMRMACNKVKKMQLPSVRMGTYRGRCRVIYLRQT